MGLAPARSGLGVGDFEHRSCVYSPGEKNPLTSKHNASFTADVAEVISLTRSSGSKKEGVLCDSLSLEVKIA